MAERLGTGLQNLVQRFDSASHLQNLHARYIFPDTKTGYRSQFLPVSSIIDLFFRSKTNYLHQLLKNDAENYWNGADYLSWMNPSLAT